MASVHTCEKSPFCRSPTTVDASDFAPAGDPPIDATRTPAITASRTTAAAMTATGLLMIDDLADAGATVAACMVVQSSVPVSDQADCCASGAGPAHWPAGGSSPAMPCCCWENACCEVSEKPAAASAIPCC